MKQIGCFNVFAFESKFKSKESVFFDLLFEINYAKAHISAFLYVLVCKLIILINNLIGTKIFPAN